MATKKNEIATEEVAEFVQLSAFKYIQNFFYLKSKKKAFSWAAFFLAPYWFFYRKLYKAGIFFLVAFTTLAILTSNQSTKLSEVALKYSEPIEKSYSEYYELYETEGTTEEQLLEKSEEVSKLLADYFRETWKSYLAIYGTNFILCLICALVADKLYYKKCLRRLSIS